MIELSKNWRIQSLPESFALQQRKSSTQKNGTITEKWVTEGYYMHIINAFNGYLSRYAGEANSVKEVLTKVQEVKNMFKEHLSISKEA